MLVRLVRDEACGVHGDRAVLDIAHLVAGPAEHGVVRFGLDLAAAMGGQILHARDAEEIELPHRPGLAGVHVQYTDDLYGDDTASAARSFEQFIGRVRATAGAAVTGTLHDLPDPDDDPARYRRRRSSYRRVVACLDAVTVCSNHEKARLEALFGPDEDVRARVAVVPLPIARFSLPPAGLRPVPRREVGVFGFVYPGKGHEDVVAAMAGLPADVAFAAVGRPGDGHHGLVERLLDSVAAQGRTGRVEGFVPDHRLVERLRSVAVPVVPGRSMSASGSLNTWLSAGRRPLVADSPYAREMASRYPGGLHLYRPGELPGAIAAVLAEGGLSWLDEPPPVELSESAIAREHLAVMTAAVRQLAVAQ